MASEYAILAKLGGFVGSNPEIVSSYPPYSAVGNQSEILNTCFPIGAKAGKFFEDKFRKYLVLSYIFKIGQNVERDDLFSFAVLLHKRDKIEIYKAVITELINILDNSGKLCEGILTEYHQQIYEGINSESDLYIEDLLIDFSRIFKEVKAKILKEKPKLRGSFI
ncbi:MAG: hypothetical protein EU542_03430 [Promethearchaeota archaeon]|nr:MAG: hypothetical protein EU542_03430 [Candidatus Lokiarchaeota archaeon]